MTLYETKKTIYSHGLKKFDVCHEGTWTIVKVGLWSFLTNQIFRRRVLRACAELRSHLPEHCPIDLELMVLPLPEQFND